MALVFPSTHPLVKHKLTLLRDMQTEPKKFRELVRELAILMAYEATADLALVDKDVTTPMGQAHAEQTGRENRPGADPARRAGHGGRHLGDDALGRSVAHRPLSRRENAAARPILQQAAGQPHGRGLPHPRPDAGDRRLGGGDGATSSSSGAPSASSSSASSPRRRASSACPRRTPTCRFTSRRSTSVSTTSATSCPAWAMRATASSARASDQ